MLGGRNSHVDLARSSSAVGQLEAIHAVVLLQVQIELDPTLMHWQHESLHRPHVQGHLQVVELVHQELVASNRPVVLAVVLTE